MKQPLIHLVCLAGALAIAGCGSSSLGDSPCEGNNPDPECMTACSVDEDCAAGFYCDTDGMCTADCAPEGSACGSGGTCDDRGRCVGGGNTDGGTDGATCPNVTLDLDPVIPTVVLLVDQSGSMTDPFNGQPRWDAVRNALTNDTTGVVTLLQDKVRFGITAYTSNGGSAGGTCPMLTSDPPDFNNRNDIYQLMIDNGPQGDTPTGESIDAVVADLMANPPPPDSPPIIVVATDGEPDTCAVPNPQEGQPEAVAAAMNSHANGIDLFILSVGSDVSAGHLQDMANAGVGLPVGGAVDAPFFVANNQSEMVDAFNQIIAGSRSCTLTLSGAIDTNEAAQGIVTMDTGSGAQTLVFDTDWIVVDSTTIELIGSACDAFLTAPSVTLSAEFPCGVVVR